METGAAPLRTTVRQRVAISIKAVLVGWVLFFMVIFAMSISAALFNHYAWANSQNPFWPLFYFGVGSAVVIFVVWFVVALPLALLVPDGSAFWSPAVLPIIGMVAGMLIVCGYQLYNLPGSHYRDWSAFVKMTMDDCLAPGFIGFVVGIAAATFHGKVRTGVETTPATYRAPRPR